MKLEGSLDAFSLPDVFQLLSFTKKTGGLHLANDGCDGVVFFRGGSITGACADNSRQPLARRLVGLGAVTDEALSAAVTTAISTQNVGVVRALREAGAVDADLLGPVAEEQVVDAVLALMRWTGGDFAFVIDEDNPDDAAIALTVEQVLEAAAAREASWEEITQVIPSPTTVLALGPASGDEVTVSRDEWALVSLVDGRRAISDIVDLAGSGQFSVVSRLAALVRRGLLAAGDPQFDRVTVVQGRLQMLEPLERFVPDVTEPPSAGDDTAEVPEQRASSEPVADEVPAETDVPDVETQIELLGGAHVPVDVVPPRPEPFLPRRAADFEDESASAELHAVPALAGAAAAPGDALALIERDPSVNRSLMLRLIAGVRGL